TWRKPAQGRVVELFDLGLDELQCGERFGPFSQQDQSLDGFFFVDPNPLLLLVDDDAALPVAQGAAKGHFAQPRQVPDDYALVADLFPRPKRPSLDELIDADRDVVRRADDDLPELTQALLFFCPQILDGVDRIAHAQDMLHRVAAAADQPQPS